VRHVSVLFLDVRGFTTISEKLGPSEVVALHMAASAMNCSTVPRRGDAVDHHSKYSLSRRHHLAGPSFSERCGEAAHVEEQHRDSCAPRRAGPDRPLPRGCAPPRRRKRAAQRAAQALALLQALRHSSNDLARSPISSLVRAGGGGDLEIAFPDASHGAERW